MSHRPLCHVLAVTALLGVAGCGQSEAPVSFSADIAPILERHCLSCHQPGVEGYDESGLGLESYEALMRGTKYGPIVIPGDPFNSNLMILVEGRADPSILMPHEQDKLFKNDVDTLRTWIEQGAANN